MVDKFKFVHDPTNENQTEILIILLEEAAEVQQIATKTLRFGPEESQPEQDLNNVQRLSLEIGDLLEMIRHAKNAGLISEDHIEQGMKNKNLQLSKYMKTFEQSN